MSYAETAFGKLQQVGPFSFNVQRTFKGVDQSQRSSLSPLLVMIDGYLIKIFTQFDANLKKRSISSYQTRIYMKMAVIE